MLGCAGAGGGLAPGGFEAKVEVGARPVVVARAKGRAVVHPALGLDAPLRGAELEALAEGERPALLPARQACVRRRHPPAPEHGESVAHLRVQPRAGIAAAARAQTRQGLVCP